MVRMTPSHLNTSLSGSPTTPVSSAISEFGILKVEAGSFASPERFLSLAMIEIVVDLVADEGAGRALVGKCLARSSRISLRWGATSAKLREGKKLAAASRPSAWRRLIKEHSEYRLRAATSDV